MIQFKNVNNFLSNDDITTLNKLSDNFEEYAFQIYSMQRIDDSELLLFKEKIKNYVKENYKLDFILNPLWINKVTESDLKSDKFHHDSSDLTIVTYFNTNFDGGNFEYYDKLQNLITINPEINLSLIMNNKLMHRITKVTKGERYSLVAFFNFQTKNKKTII
jgi:Rps23 Pro-64 3,4-dihydroxylase Tpa1-like proline 4-hydroxylase